jgi:hypothetical protein
MADEALDSVVVKVIGHPILVVLGALPAWWAGSTGFLGSALTTLVSVASMAANLLARHFKIPFADYFSIDISADSHVCRGLCYELEKYNGFGYRECSPMRLSVLVRCPGDVGCASKGCLTPRSPRRSAM